MQEQPEYTTQQVGFTNEELLAAVNIATDRIIRPRMRSYDLGQWADDVAGEVMLSAWKSREKFDPQRGRLQSWINQIAKYRLADRVDIESRKHGHLILDGDDSMSPDEILERLAATAADQVVDDFAVAVAEQLATTSWLQPVVAAAASVMDTASFIVGFLTYVRFDSHAANAAEKFGVSAQRIRDCKRSFELHCQVIHRAQQKRAELVGQVHLSDLLDCLPEEGSAGAWTRQVSAAIQTWPGRLSEVTVDHVVAETGWKANTARQYLPITRTLLQVALGVLEAKTTEGE